MASIPSIFRREGTNSIATYNYYDFAEGTGLKQFYGATTDDDKILTENQVYSSDIELSGGVSNAAFSASIDQDFDLSTFNTPKTLYGTALISFAHYHTTNTDSYGHFYIRKWDGTTETEIANASGAVMFSGAAMAKIETIAIPITTKTRFKKGETLRVTANIVARRNTGAAEKVSIGTDPMNRDGALIKPTVDNTTTKFQLWIPFLLPN